MLLRFLFLLSLLISPLPVAAADWSKVGAPDVPVNLEADELSYDKRTGRYRAAGNVQMQQGEMQLRSRILWWNQQSGEVEAEGEVELSSPDETMTGNKLFYDLEQGTGRVEEGHVFLRESNLHVRGKAIEKRGELDYRVTEGTFTTCDGDVPSWKFGADQLDVTLGGFARAKNAVFYLTDIPSLYVPYMIYPVDNERKSGLLTPTFGSSERRGIQYSGAYYQVLGRNQDATFYFDYLSEMGFGKGLEYRYAFGKQNAGEARVYHIDVNRVDGVSVGEERYALEWQHDGSLPGGVRMVVDAEYVDDEDYFQDFGEVAEVYNKDKAQSVFSLSKNWGKANLVGQFKYTKDLEIDDPTTLQLLPRIDFDITRQRLGRTPFYYAFESEYTNFWRDQGLRGQRLAVRPSLSASFQLWNVIEVNPEVGYRDRYYWDLSDGSGGEQEGIVDFSTKVTTRLQRIYDQPIGPVSKLRHSVEPEATYKYTPADDQGHLPSFDSIDRIAEANRVEYALVQRLVARFDHDGGNPTYRELAYLRLSQSYDLREEARQQPFQPIRADLILLPTDWSKFRLDTTFDVDQGEWSRVSAEGEIHDQRENSLSVNYRSDRDQEIDYALLDLTLAWLRPVYLSYQQRYDFAVGEQLAQDIGIEYRQQCWSALLSFSEYNEDRSIMLSFTMKGLGAVGGIGGSLGAF